MKHVRHRSVQSLIKATQRGAITISNGSTSATATISATDVANAELRYLGGSFAAPGTGTDPRTIFVRIEFTNATTITAYINTTPSVSVTVQFEVIEYWPGIIRSVTRGTVTMSATDNTVTLSPTVNTGTTHLNHLGYTDSNATLMEATSLASLTLTDGATVTASQRGGLSGILGYEVVEFAA